MAPPAAQLALVTEDWTPPANIEAAQTPCQRLVAEVIDHTRAIGRPLHRRTLGQLCARTKELLEDGFDYDLVREAALVAILGRGSIRHIVDIAEELASARTGALLTRRDYERRLHSEMEIARLEKRL